MSDSVQPLNCMLPGSSVHGILQARALYGCILITKLIEQGTVNVSLENYKDKGAEQGTVNEGCKESDMTEQLTHST